MYTVTTHIQNISHTHAYRRQILKKEEEVFLFAKLFINIALKELAYCHFTITDLNLKNPILICLYAHIVIYAQFFTLFNNSGSYTNFSDEF